MKKFLLAMLITVMTLAMSMSLFAGCGTSAVLPDVEAEDDFDEEEEYTIEFFGWGSDEEIKNYSILIDDFMKEYPNITVVYDATSSDDYMKTLTNRANSLPDVFCMPDENFTQWAYTGRLMNIGSLCTDEELAEIWTEGVDRYRYNRETAEFGNVEGAGLYGLPKDLGPYTLCYNVELFNQLCTNNNVSQDIIDLVSPTDPMSWDELITVLTAIDTSTTDSIYGIGSYDLYSAVYSNDTDFFVDGDYTKSNMDDPKFAEAVQFIADLYLEYEFMPSADAQSSTNAYQRFMNKQAVFSWVGPWDQTSWWETLGFEWDIIPAAYNDKYEDARSTSYTGSMSFSMSANTSSPGASMLLMKYLSMSEESQRTNYTLGQAIPNRIDMQDEYINNTEGLLTGNQLYPASRSVFVDIADGFDEENGDNIGSIARPTYYTYTTDWYDTDFLGSTNMTKVWDGEMTASDYCSSFHTTFQSALDEMYSTYV